MRLLDVVNLILTLSLYSNLVVRLAWEHEIGHGHLAVSIQCLDAALVDEDAQHLFDTAWFGCDEGLVILAEPDMVFLIDEADFAVYFLQKVSRIDIGKMLNQRAVIGTGEKSRRSMSCFI